MSNMQNTIRVSKITFNIGGGLNKARLEKGEKLIEQLTGVAPVKTVTQKRIPSWGLRPGLPIGLKLTLRGKKAREMLARALFARDNTLPQSAFDNSGNLSFGIKEYVDIKDAKYSPEIGMMGLELSVTLEKPGYRVKRRAIRNAKVGPRQQLTKEEAITFIEQEYKVSVA